LPDQLHSSPKRIGALEKHNQILMPQIADNKYGQLSEFRERLSYEVYIQTGEEFPVFQDRDDILLGQNWTTN
jgi:hypothetical protein